MLGYPVGLGATAFGVGCPSRRRRSSSALATPTATGPRVVRAKFTARLDTTSARTRAGRNRAVGADPTWASSTRSAVSASRVRTLVSRLGTRSISRPPRSGRRPGQGATTALPPRRPRPTSTCWWARPPALPSRPTWRTSVAEMPSLPSLRLATAAPFGARSSGGLGADPPASHTTIGPDLVLAGSSTGMSDVLRPHHCLDGMVDQACGDQTNTQAYVQQS